MRNLTKLTEEEIEFIIKCIQTFDILKNDNREYSDIIEKVMDKVNIIDMNDKKKVVFEFNGNITESHTFIIDESYEIDEEEYDYFEIYEELENKFGEPLLEIEDYGWMDMTDMNIIN